MAREKIVFIAFAKKDEGIRNLFSGQKVHPKTPFKFTDMSVKKAYDGGWKRQTRTRRSDGVIVLISSATPKASGQLWEIKCAAEEDGCRTKPVAMAGTPCKECPGQT